MAEECIHGIDGDFCSICRHGPAVREPVTVVTTFRARFDGECPECGFPIAVGQVVHKLSNDRYIHEGCE